MITMKQMKRIAISILFLASLAAVPVFASDLAMPPLAMPTAASDGFGGTHVAYTDNVFALLVNPAAMIRVQERSFFTLAPSFFNPQSTIKLGRSITGLASGDTGALGDAANVLSEQRGRIALGFELREFPLSIAWVANGFGFGLWNRSFVNANIIGTTVGVNVFSDVVLPVGFAFKILDKQGHTLDMGLTVKGFTRIWAREQERIIALMDNASDLEDRIHIPVIIGGGFDAGFMYRWDMGLQAGFTLDDIFSRGYAAANILGKGNNSYYIPFTMNLGLAYDFKVSRYWINTSKFLGSLGFAVAFDWRDMRNAFLQDDYLRRNALLDLGVGFQLSLFDIFLIRLGMNEMLPAFGLGFNLGPCKIDLAFYGRELGYEPGQLSVAAVDLSFSVRPGAKERTWPWARRSMF